MKLGDLRKTLRQPPPEKPQSSRTIPYIPVIEVAFPTDRWCGPVEMRNYLLEKAIDSGGWPKDTSITDDHLLTASDGAAGLVHDYITRLAPYRYSIPHYPEIWRFCKRALASSPPLVSVFSIAQSMVESTEGGLPELLLREALKRGWMPGVEISDTGMMKQGSAQAKLSVDWDVMEASYCVRMPHYHPSLRKSPADAFEESTMWIPVRKEKFTKR